MRLVSQGDEELCWSLYGAGVLPDIWRIIHYHSVGPNQACEPGSSSSSSPPGFRSAAPPTTFKQWLRPGDGFMDSHSDVRLLMMLEKINFSRWDFHHYIGLSPSEGMFTPTEEPIGAPAP